MAGEVALVAESSLAAVTLVWLVAVHLKHMLLQRFIFSELGVTLVTEECTIFCSGEIIANGTHNIIIFDLSRHLIFDINSPQLESEYSECSSAMSSVRRDLEVLGQTSECCGDGEPQDEQFRRLK